MSDSKPYRSGPSIKTGDRVVFVDGDGGRTEGIAHVDSAIEWNRKRDHETRVAIAPDGVETTSYIPTAEGVRHLREQSGAPVTMCRDALAAEDGNQGRAAEWLRLRSTERWPDGGPRRPDNDDTGTVSASIPDGEPWEYGRDFTLGDRHVCDDTCSVGLFAPVPDWLPERPSNVARVETDIPAIDADLQFTAHRWLPRDPIPYDEMRRLCGLPDVSAYIARRELARMGRELREGFRRFGEAWAEAAEQALPGLRAISEAAKPKQAPPIWAQNPAGQHRPTKTRNHRRVK